MEFEDWVVMQDMNNVSLKEAWEAGAAAEREQCAKIADLLYSHGPVKAGLVYCDDVSEAIRGRV